MADGLDVRADVLNFREEARGCFELAQVETRHDVKIVLMGMALGWLRLANSMQSSGTLTRGPSHES